MVQRNERLNEDAAGNKGHVGRLYQLAGVDEVPLWPLAGILQPCKVYRSEAAILHGLAGAVWKRYDSFAGQDGSHLEPYGQSETNDIHAIANHDGKDPWHGQMNILVTRSWLVIVAALILASGCGLMSPAEPYAGMAGALRPYSSPTTAAQPFQGPLTLDEVIRVAMANNPEVAAMAHDVEAFDAQRQAAGSQRWPRVYVTGGFNRYLDSQRLIAASENGQAGAFSRDIFASDLVISMPLFTGGRITSEIEATTLLYKAADHRLARTREELVFKVSSIFYGILAQRRVIASLEFSIDALQEHLKRVEDLIAAQKAADVDRLRTEVRLADLQQQLVRERNVLAVQLRVLTNLLGLDCLEKPIEPTGQLTFAEKAIPGIDRALRQAFESRCDYLAARAELEAQARALDAARGAQLPTILLQGAYGGRWAANTTDQPSGVDSSGDVGRVGLVVDIPVFEGGRINARIRLERARLLAAQERLRRLELQIQLDVETAVLNVGSAAQRVQATEKAIEQAKESLRIEREKYEVGKGAVVDVLDAQAALFDSQKNYYLALAEYNVAVAQLRLAIGAQDSW